MSKHSMRNRIQKEDIRNNLGVANNDRNEFWTLRV